MHVRAWVCVHFVHALLSGQQHGSCKCDTETRQRREHSMILTSCDPPTCENTPRLDQSPEVKSELLHVHAVQGHYCH